RSCTPGAEIPAAARAAGEPGRTYSLGMRRGIRLRRAPPRDDRGPLVWWLLPHRPGDRHRHPGQLEAMLPENPPENRLTPHENRLTAEMRLREILEACRANSFRCEEIAEGYQRGSAAWDAAMGRRRVYAAIARLIDVSLGSSDDAFGDYIRA